MRPREALALGLATLALTARPVAAQQPAVGDGSGNKEQAARLASEAEALGKKQQFADALSKYKEAAKLDPATAAYQCNIGMAYYALGDEARAHLYFGRCKRANGSWPANVEDVFNYVVGVLGKEDFTPLTISGTPEDAEVLINLYAEEGPLVAPVTVYVPFSNYQIQVRAEGFETKQIPVEANNRSEKSVSFDLKPAANTGTGALPAGNGSGAGNLVGSGEADPEVDTGGGRKKWPLVLAGGGLLAGGIGIYTFTRAKHNQDKLCNKTIDDPETPEVDETGTCDGFYPFDDRDDLEGKMRLNEVLTYSLWGIGAAAIGAGLVLYFTQPEGSQSSVAVSAAPSTNGGMVFFSLTH